MLFFVVGGFLACMIGFGGMLVSSASEQVIRFYIICMIGLLISLLGWVALVIHVSQTGGPHMI